jgi:hypothetical protein
MKLFTLIFCCVISFTAFWYGIKLIKLYLRVKKWQRVKATITRKSVVKRKLASASRAGFTPSLDYSYTVNGINYIGHRIFLAEILNGERGFLKQAAEKYIEKLKPEIEIYVDPADPTKAVMNCDGIAMYVIALVMGTMSLLIGIGNYLS